MKFGLLLLTVWALACPALSQTSESLVAPTVEQQRTRIQQQIAEQDAKSAAEEAGCQARFAVTDCLVDVRHRRREAVADLKRQEASLNSQQRRQKGGDQLVRLEEKVAARGVRLESGQPTSVTSEKIPKIAVRAEAQPQPVANKVVETGPSAEDRALQERRYNDKLQAAQARKAKKEKNLALKPARKPQPLPVPG